MFTTRPSSISVANTIANAGARLLQSRRLVRAPIWIYKARAGALLGSRVLMLEHIGRKSGAARYVVLEAFDHPTPDTFVVPSGFGEKAQWFRNLKANPRVRSTFAATRRSLPLHGSSSSRKQTSRSPPTSVDIRARGHGSSP